jgi:polyisoprenoid-binding protein YceI
MVTEVEGAFKTFDAKVTSSKDDFSDAVIELSADPASISTDNDNRDNHLKSPDFFDVAKFTTLTFKSTSFKKVEDKKYKLVGDLTLHGVTKSVELEVTLNGVGANPMSKKTVAGFKVSGKFKRTDFGVGQAGGTVVGEEIHVRANIELVKN